MATIISGRTLFIRNLPYSATDEKLEQVFSSYGPVKSSFVVKERDTSKSRGFGYVVFSMREDAETAKTKVSSMDGRKLFVTFANKKPKRPKGKKTAEKDEEKSDSDNTDDDDDDDGDDDKGGDKASPPKTKPTPQSVDNETKKRTHEKRVKGRSIVISDANAESAQMLVKLTKNSIGTTFPTTMEKCAVVEYMSRKDALNAIRKIKSQQEAKSVSLLSNYSRPQGTIKKSRLIVRNLAFTCKESDLKEVFSSYGTVSEITIPQRAGGKSSGFGFIQFENVPEADKAIKAMNGKSIKGRPVAVDWAISKDKFQLAKQQAQEAAGSEASDSDEDSEEEVQTKNVKKKPKSQKKSKVQESESEEEDAESEEEEDEESSDESEDEEQVQSKNVKSKQKSKVKDTESEDSEESEEEEEEEEESDSDEEKMEIDSGNGSENEDDEDSDEDSSEDSDMDSENEDKKGKIAEKSDTDEGKTIFIRNLSFNCDEGQLQEEFAKYGDIVFAKVVVDPNTEHSRGTAFVKFKSCASADKCVEKAEDTGQDGGITLDGRQLNITLAVSRERAEKLRKKRKDAKKEDNKDGRNMWLAREGVIRPGTLSAEGLTKEDLVKRTKVEQIKRQKLKNPNVFVSTTRLCVRNIPTRVDDAELRKVYLKSAGDKAAKISECRVMRDLANVNAGGKAKSRGYAFVNFTEHKHALAALRTTNNNPELFGEKKRLIVEFSLENRTALQAKEKRVERNQAKTDMLKKGKETYVTAGRQKKEKKKAEIVTKPVDEDDDDDHPERKKGIKAMPSHWGPKVRHKKRPAPPKASKTKETASRQQKRKAVEVEKAEPASKRKKWKKGSGVKTDDFDKLVSRYTQKLSSAIKQPASKKTKWFSTD